MNEKEIEEIQWAGRYCKEAVEMHYNRIAPIIRKSWLEPLNDQNVRDLIHALEGIKIQSDMLTTDLRYTESKKNRNLFKRFFRK